MNVRQAPSGRSTRRYEVRLGRLGLTIVALRRRGFPFEVTTRWLNRGQVSVSCGWVLLIGIWH